MQKQKYTGVVMTWFPERGFGFVHAMIDGEKQSFFAHIADMVGIASVGSKVSFDIREHKKGPRAVNIEVLGIEAGTAALAKAGA
jgi:cold shock CspA family protein